MKVSACADGTEEVTGKPLKADGVYKTRGQGSRGHEVTEHVAFAEQEKRPPCASGSLIELGRVEGFELADRAKKNSISSKARAILG